MNKITLFFKTFLLLGIVIFTYGKYLENKSPEKIMTTATEEKFIKKQLGNITILESNTKIYGYDNGFQYGELLKTEIEEVVTILDEKVLGKYGPAKFSIKTILLQKAFSLEEHIPEIYIQEMKGVADGANVKYSDILLINTYDDLLYLSGCSSLSGNTNKNNTDFFHARNLDYPIIDLAGKTVLLNNAGIITIGFPGYIGALTATNSETKISISSHTSVSKNAQDGIPTAFLYREIIENAKNMQDAKNILESAKRTIGNNLLVSSFFENTSSVFEFDSNKIIERKSNEFSMATNHFVSTHFTKNASPNSKKRYNALENFSINNVNITAKQVQEIFSTYDKNPTGWSTVSNFGTVQSIIIFPKSKNIFLANGKTAPVTSAGYIEYKY